jgi:hypothetical protein
MAINVAVKWLVSGESKVGQDLGAVNLRLVSEKITVRELISRTVTEQIKELTETQKAQAATIHLVLARQYLTTKDINQLTETGRIRLPSEKKVNKADSAVINVEEEINKALNGFDTQAFRVLADGDQMESLDQELVLTDDTKLVFLRLTPFFSEAMRDADLVVSVAQLHEGDGHWSAESYQRRVELVNEIINDLGLKGVSCEGHFAYIQGKLANYRVHLGSAAIHIQPGNYLCIVYARDPNKNQQAFFLPIADAEPKTSEVISKILLLVNDNKIKDQSILSQINAAQTA